jgi:hypothetical protein
MAGTDHQQIGALAFCELVQPAADACGSQVCELGRDVGGSAFALEQALRFDMPRRLRSRCWGRIRAAGSKRASGADV